MSRHMKLALLAVAALFFMSACGDRDDIADEVRDYIDNTRDSAYRFTYSEVLIDVPAFPDVVSGRVGGSDFGKTTTRDVNGVVLDDFQTFARLTVDGTAIRDEIITDDILAVRYLDGSAVKADIDTAALALVDTETSIEDIPVTDVLESQRWVVDPVGAPALSNARSLRDLGSDPLFDAFTILDYVEQAINDAATVGRYREGAISQAYRSSEDTFPLPDEDAGIARYDLVRPRLPNGADLASGETSESAEARHFRKMAIYVKDDKIIEVREDLAPRGTQLRETVSYLRDVAEAADQDTSFIDASGEQIQTMEPNAAVSAVMTTVNFVSELSGGDPIVPRIMLFQIIETDEEITVDVPTGDDVVEGNLAVLINRGVKPAGLDDSSTDSGVSDPTVENTGDVPADGATEDGTDGGDGGAAGTSPAGEDAPTDDTGAGPPGDPDAATEPESPPGG